MNKEEIILKHFLKISNEPDKISLNQKLIKITSLLIGIVLILTSYFLISSEEIMSKIAVICGVFGGGLIFFWSFYSNSIISKLYVKKYINKNAIEARLNEIKT